MKRATRKPSVVFREVLALAEKDLLLKGDSAAVFKHRGIRGDERAAALDDFLKDHLPNAFATGKGEAIDCSDNRTGQLDSVIYDTVTSAPILTSAENLLIPAEALYYVIEVKSILNQEELNKCAKAAMAVRSLQPFKQSFVPSPINGATQKGRIRCPYIIFAYKTDLNNDDWAQKEFDRIKSAVATVGGGNDLFDRVIVLDRGMIRPQVANATLKSDASDIFLEMYVHMINFLTRERGRRPAIDWEAYRSRPAWVKLN